MTWLADFLYSHSQRVALNGTLSSPLPVKAGVPRGSVLGPVLFLIFINDLSDSLENPLYLFVDDATLCHNMPHPSDKLAAASFHFVDLDRIMSWSSTWNMALNLDTSHTLTVSLKGPSGEPLTFSSLKILLKLSDSNFWASQTAMIHFGKPHFKVGLQSQSPAGHLLSSKVLPWHT